jgi:transcription initiation factor IIF auxiliary subunit
MSDISAQHILATNESDKIEYWKPDSKAREHFHLKISLEGSPFVLDEVEHVEYRLHKSFRKPERVSHDRANNFAIDVWTWGMFMVYITVFWKGGSESHMQHYLSYELPPDNGTNYVEVTPNTTTQTNAMDKQT